MKISAIDIKRMWYADEITYALTPWKLQQLVGKRAGIGSVTEETTGTAKEIENVHQDTWQIDESEASQDSYRNQLTGHVYRLGKRQMGELTVNFTVGQYDYKTKAALMGGDVLDNTGAKVTNPTGAATEVGWARAKDTVEMYKTLIALTVDNVYVCVSRSSLGARESSTDGAIGMAMSGTMTDPVTAGVGAEYWYDAATVNAATEPSA